MGLLKSFLQVIIAVLFIIALATGIFLGMGYIIFLFLPLTLFQSNILILGVVFVVMFTMLVFSVTDYFNELRETDQWDDYEDEYYDEDDDDDFDEYDEFDLPLEDDATFKNQPHPKLSITGENKTGRNQPCPCGSGKKYKNCCGK